MLIRIAGAVNDSIVDGPGFRYTVFTQGCPHHCPGCHNPATHDFTGGREVEAESLIGEMADNPLLDGLTLSGGEPFSQIEACAYLARRAREMGLNVWSYTGYVYETLLKNSEARALLRELDVLVDGPFLLKERTLELRFRGSRNQRLIDVKKSLETGKTVLYDLKY